MVALRLRAPAPSPPSEAIAQGRVRTPNRRVRTAPGLPDAIAAADPMFPATPAPGRAPALPRVRAAEPAVVAAAAA